MNVLVLEDRGSVSFYLEQALQCQGHSVFSAFSIGDAQGHWDTEKIDCIIADCNMSPEGLLDEEIRETHAGLLTGWIWLRHHVFAERADMKGRTALFSGYMERIKQIVSADELRGVYLVPKRGQTSPAVALLAWVERVAHQIER